MVVKNAPNIPNIEKVNRIIFSSLTFNFVEWYTVDNLPSFKATAINWKYIVVILFKIPHPGLKQTQNDLIREGSVMTENSHQISKPILINTKPF